MSIYLQSIDNYIENKSTCIWATNGDEIYFISQISNLEKDGSMFFSTECLWDCVGDIVIGSNIDKMKGGEKKCIKGVVIYLVNQKAFSSKYYTPEILLTVYLNQNSMQIKIMS